jgi:hypothetical protein
VALLLKFQNLQVSIAFYLSLHIKNNGLFSFQLLKPKRGRSGQFYFISQSVQAKLFKIIEKGKFDINNNGDGEIDHETSHEIVNHVIGHEAINQIVKRLASLVKKLEETD